LKKVCHDEHRLRYITEKLQQLRRNSGEKIQPEIIRLQNDILYAFTKAQRQNDDAETFRELNSNPKQMWLSEDGSRKEGSAVENVIYYSGLTDARKKEREDFINPIADLAWIHDGSGYDMQPVKFHGRHMSSEVIDLGSLFFHKFAHMFLTD